MGDKVDLNQVLTQGITDFLATRPDLDKTLHRRVDDPISWLVTQLSKHLTEDQLRQLVGVLPDMVKTIMSIAETLLTGRIYRK